MSLGVLNNLNAMYAENNLNNTSNSLSTVLNQLSSGSKINSGADDAAGLSLVNGLQANSVALAQSKTNAQEGVGLLTVADGALSQVTNLLNRAVTLATEASNGTLNASQDTAANQEYQSILAEISNIGSTTTYNGQAVFGSRVDIYTGDSSTQGASINSLNIGSLSSSNVGDSNGVMAYSNGLSNVFLDLSSTNKNAQSTDSLNASGKSTINVNYLVKGANGASTPATTSITVGTGTSFANTVNGMISAINGSGLGLSATFATQSQAGVAGGGTQTGIQITGGLLSVGVDPAASSTGGTLSFNNGSAILGQGQTIAIQSGSAEAISIAVSPTIQTLSDLAGAINTASALNASNGKTQVVATVITHSDNTQSLSLANATNNGGTLSVSNTAGSYAPAFSAGSVVTGTPVGLTFSAGSTGSAAVPGGPDTPAIAAVATLGIGGIGANNANAALSGTLSLTHDGHTVTVTMGSNSANDATHINLDTNHSNLTGLAEAINSSTIAPAAKAALGLSAAVTANGLTLTSLDGATAITGDATSLTATPAVTLQSVVAGAAPSAGTPGTTVISMTGGPGLNGADTLKAGTSIVVTNGSLNSPGTPITFEVGGDTANNTATHFYTGAANTTVNDLVGIMNSGAGAVAAGLSGAVLSGANGNINLTSATVGTTINATGTAVDQIAVGNGTVVGATPQNDGSIAAASSFTTAVGLDTNSDPITMVGDKLTGSLTLTNGGAAVTITMNSNAANDATHINLASGSSNLAGLRDAINGSSAAATALGMTASLNATNTGLSFSTAKLGTQMLVDTSALTTVSDLGYTNPVSGDVNTYASGTIGLGDGGKFTADPTLTGQVVVTAPGVTDTFIMGAGSDTLGGNANTIHVVSGKLSDLLAAINTEGGQNGATPLGNTLDLTAISDTSTGGIFLQAANKGAATFYVDASALKASLTSANTNGVAGNAVVPQAIPATALYGTGTTNRGTDVVSGTITIKNTTFAGGADTVFTMGASAYNSSNPAATGLGTNAIAVNGNTMDDLIRAIKADSEGSYSGATGIGLDASMKQDGSGLLLTSKDATTTLSDATSTLKSQYTINTVAPNPGNPVTGATYASAVLSTGQAIGTGAELSGAITLKNGGSDYTFTMAGSSAGSTSTAINTNGTKLTDLRDAISQSGIGITASIVNGALQLQSNNSNTAISVTGTPTLKDTAAETFTGGVGTPLVPGTPGTPATPSTATVNLASPTATGADRLTGDITLTGNAGPVTFTMGTPGLNSLDDLVGKINADQTLGITATKTNSGFSLSMAGTTSPISGTSNLQDAAAFQQSSATLGSFRSQNDTLSAGVVNFKVGTSNQVVNTTDGETVTQLMADINSNNHAKGVTATWDSGTNKVVLTSNTYGDPGNISATSSNVTDTTTGGSLSYVAASAYNVGISNSTDASTALYDSSDQTNPTQVATNTKYTNFSAQSGGTRGVATISYSDGAGVSLAATDLSNQLNAQAALTAIHQAIIDVAAQDGYIGAQINTLNTVSSVLSTQQQNVVSAQNAVQATDYAQAASNMSKYQILSQTGISALAQANSMQQEVTKLLQ
jgi:flagellin